MTNWDDIAKNSAKETDAELEAGLEKLTRRDTGGLMPTPPDQAALDALMVKINADTRYNERLAAFKACAATLTADGLKALRKAMLALLACLALAGTAAAQEMTASGINIKDLLANTRIGVWLPIEGGRTFKTVYAPIIWLHGSDGTEYVCLDAGSAAPAEITRGYAFLALGLRVDNILNKSLGLSKWLRAHVSAAQLPSLEVGVGPILYQSKVRWGASAAIKF